MMEWYKVLASVYDALGLKRVIYDRESREPYMVRYYIFSTRWLEKFFPKLSYRLVLHNVLRSDIDGLHDHPWPWKSKILSGGYWEETTQSVHWHNSKSGWRSCPSNFFHKLILDKEKAKEDTWTLFLMGPKEKDWNFLDKNMKPVQWEEYLNNRDKYI